MASIVPLPSGRWRAQVRVSGIYRGRTFDRKRDAKAWASAMESQARSVAAAGFAAPPPKATLADLIDAYGEQVTKRPGKTKAATLRMLRERIGAAKLASMNAGVLRDFIDRRAKDGAGGVTIAADLSFLSAVLQWGRHARRWDIPDTLAREARASLKHRRLDARSNERSREPTDDELARLRAHWMANKRQRVPMPTIVDFALATAMRLGEICGLMIEDIDRESRTVVIRDRKDPKRKAGNDQRVPLLPAAWAIVEPLIADRDHGKVFAGVQAASVSTAFTRAVQALGIDDLHFHDIRHRATRELFRAGLGIPEVALMTGHKTWAQLRRYTDVQPADVLAKLGARDDS